MHHLRYALTRTILTLAASFLTLSVRAHTPAEEMADAAGNFLAALTPAQQAKALFEVKDAERLNWNFVPMPRRGLPFKEMNSAQRLLGQALLNTALSHRGYLKATTIMSLEEILRDLEQGRGPTRDPELYYVSLFGQPQEHGTWGWRVEGHHLSLNFLIVNGDDIALTPSFFGSNPAEVLQGPRKGLRVLGSEEDLGRRLVQSLDEPQRKLAIYTNTAPREIITGTDRKARALKPAGISATQLTEAQKTVLWQIIEEYVHRYRPELADADLAKIDKSGRDRLLFAWAGGIEPGQPHYYRVQGPTFLMEFDNTQNNANHIHTVWRDFAHDFGEDLLREHYDQVPHER